MKYIPLCVAACIAILFSAPSPAHAARLQVTGGTHPDILTDNVPQSITVMVPSPPTSQGCGCTLGPGTASMLLSSLILTLVPLVYVLWTLRRKKRARRSPGFG